MQNDITTFIHSDSGLMIGLLLLVIGLIDLIFGYFLIKRHPEKLPLPFERLKPAITGLFFMASLIVLTGLYFLYLRGAAA